MLTRYDRLGASSRVRFIQYLPWLQAKDVDVTVAPFFSNDYVRDLQVNKKNKFEVLKAFTSRLCTLLSNRSFDLLWIEKEALPWVPAVLEFAFLPKSIPYVLDYDDAVFHHYDQNSNFLVKKLLGDKHATLMRGAALVVAGNSYIADFAQKAGAKRVEIVPSVINLDRYQVRDSILRELARAAPRVGWIGQRSTALLLLDYKQIFERLTASCQARFIAVGIDAESLGLPMESIPWNEQTEVASIASFDIGIMPLVDEPFERGKCGYKLIQYMACGLPVVASPVGVNCQIVEHGVNGFLAETPEQWEHALQTLLSSAILRQRMGQAGRAKVEREYCTQITGPRLADLLKESVRAYRLSH